MATPVSLPTELSDVILSLWDYSYCVESWICDEDVKIGYCLEGTSAACRLYQLSSTDACTGICLSNGSATDTVAVLVRGPTTVNGDNLSNLDTDSKVDLLAISPPIVYIGG